ncbi:MAG: biopolymer transporter ExbD [Bacteroidales bacterium]|nr:biopolymer transporter ExbD [Bacteroidales bacterium]
MIQRHIQQINTSSMADIAFLLLIFFLVSTTMESDIGVMRKLPPLVPPAEALVNDRNILVVLVNRNNELMVEGENVDIELLRETTREFILNKNNDIHLPVVEYKTFPIVGELPVTPDHVISLRSDRGTTYEMYIAVQNELVAAYNELRCEMAIENWNTPYKNLTKDMQDIINDIYPVRISEAEPHEHI